MSKERELIKDMKILLECTYIGGLQRNADVLIGRAIELLAQPEQEPVAWSSLSDIQWINIVNDPKILELTGGRHSFEDAVSLAIVMTEEKCKVNNSNSNSPPTRKPLSEDEIQDALIKHRRSTIWDCGFKVGVKYAEQKHGISGGGNETM